MSEVYKKLRKTFEEIIQSFKEDLDDFEKELELFVTDKSYEKIIQSLKWDLEWFFEKDVKNVWRRIFNAGIKLLWYRLFIRKNEFDTSLELDSEAMLVMSDKEVIHYLDDLNRRRGIAHRRDLESKESAV